MEIHYVASPVFVGGGGKCPGPKSLFGWRQFYIKIVWSIYNKKKKCIFFIYFDKFIKCILIIIIER